MKRGGEEIYVGPLGHHSTHLIRYFEVSKLVLKEMSAVLVSHVDLDLIASSFFFLSSHLMV